MIRILTKNLWNDQLAYLNDGGKKQALLTTEFVSCLLCSLIKKRDCFLRGMLEEHKSSVIRKATKYQILCSNSKPLGGGDKTCSICIIVTLWNRTNAQLQCWLHKVIFQIGVFSFNWEHILFWNRQPLSLYCDVIWSYLWRQKSTYGYLCTSHSVVMNFKKRICFCWSDHQRKSKAQFDWVWLAWEFSFRSRNWAMSIGY